MGEAYRQWKEEKRGLLSTFPFGAFAYARLDDRLASEPLWSEGPRLEGRDPMGLTPSQPNIEIVSTECYGGPEQFDNKFPDGETTHAFALMSEPFASKSRGSVTWESGNPLDNPIVDHNFLADELDVLVLSEGCRFVNEIVMKGKGTAGIIDGSWPPDLTYHKYTTREKWVPLVKENATPSTHSATLD